VASFVNRERAVHRIKEVAYVLIVIVVGHEDNA
jgi:hypothetical protein